MTKKSFVPILDCPLPNSVVQSEIEDPDYPTSNVLDDQCRPDGSNEWRGTGNNSEFVMVLGCRQDITGVLMKNGFKDYQSQNFTISIGTYIRGPWKEVLKDSFPANTSEVNYLL